MKTKLAMILVFNCLFSVFINPGMRAEESINAADCSFNGYPLYGKIQLVDSFPDLTVQVVNAFPNLKVQLVESFPNQCGLWQIVTSFPDTKIKIVESFPDVKIQYVDSFPGLP
ncbi:hypothetical protein IQ219_05230 [Synechocystis sp. LEGE 06083]|uniref:hypothetical protein n=1 Tax=Synechocystis sp. LEGE 06083 TaxID=915336 RepID=UPI00187F29A9|nr:hypothetical protein [Synechocystis sp. LEGE 06083]MBE9194724.1 hypothetical protein [Synechocystis sp. LEGE 06083]